MDVVLGFISVFSSTTAAVFGLGGGLILISFLPDFLAPELIIPIHGVTQLSSNASRSFMVFRSIEWKLVPMFLVGSLLGSMIFTFVLINIPTTYIPSLIGIYIILKLWSRKTERFLSSFDSYYLLGFLQTGLGLVVGSTGHIALPRLISELKERDKIVATSGIFMTLSHGLKLLIFGLLGFHFRQYGILLIFMVSGAFIGSYLGTKLRDRFNENNFQLVLKLLLTLLAVKMIIGTIG